MKKHIQGDALIIDNQEVEYVPNSLSGNTSPINNNIEKLGKIESIEFGHCGYNDSMLGIKVTLSFGSSRVDIDKSFWDYNLIKRTANCNWIEEDRDKEAIEIMRYISDLLHKAKVSSVSKLVGIPVEITMNEKYPMQVDSFRILEEVL